MTTSTASGCLLGNDNSFGPRINILCRPFDFTLLFEDAFFTVLPTTLLMLVLPPRLRFLQKVPIKLESYKLAIYKLVTIQTIENQINPYTS
jgi:ATP-binding cassette, subfamily C (CFTR/MRP), member 1